MRTKKIQTQSAPQEQNCKIRLSPPDDAPQKMSRAPKANHNGRPPPMKRRLQKPVKSTSLELL